ncbi:5-deoxy-glucuronate isomerase [Acidiferrimicrobium sp. IK]|uniref:5-deoxy-glucuronate isomerase n=1 Tax=Acidiferrimicrobium sp. IK TaxID=2871700 RepID=UPI0021CB3E2B|nr:5-deoxy-glucuronate isomerase [Acidiferrimicrobium sp. IK]MCU4186888.1 5-deoxy-glucuronate isomerase [Acidiferrimicrobium sp. IK]
MTKTVVAPGRETDIIQLDLADLADGQSWEQSSEQETAVVILSGEVDVEFEGKDAVPAGGRKSVFEAPGHTVYAPPGCPLRLTARGPAELAVASAAVGDGTAGSARVIGPEDQRIAEVGQSNWSRSVRTILGPEHSAGRLLLGETINPPGNWSSYPAHKHDRQAPPEEVRLEEVYLFKVDPAGGFGVQLRYDDAGTEEAFFVRNDDAAAIRSGYHPVVAAPGYSLYYLWVMAGDGREMIPHFDPHHAWLQQSR